MVVIAIIAILAALLLPALSRARSAADSAACKSNLRQWGIALRLYVEEFQVYPPVDMAEVTGEYGHKWFERMHRYTGARWTNWLQSRSLGSPRPMGIQACPGYLRIGGYIAAPDFFSYGFGSYAYNDRGYVDYGRIDSAGYGLGGDVVSYPHQVRGDTPASKLRLIREAECVRPSDMVGIGDGETAWGPVSAELLYYPYTGPSSFSLAMPPVSVELDLGLYPASSAPNDVILKSRAGFLKRHGGRWNVVFLDGHVEGLRTKDLWHPKMDSVAKRWNRDNQPHPEMRQ